MRTNYRTFAELNALLGSKQGRKLGNNTYAVRLAPDTIGVRLHSTIVVTLTPTRIVLNSGGWHTVTTKDRLNTYLPQTWGVCQERGLWYLRRYVCTNGEGNYLAVNAGYRDGITLELGPHGWALAQDSEVLA